MALLPDAALRGAYATLAELAPDLDVFRSYALDREARPSAMRGPLFAAVPGGTAPIDARIAAILGAPSVQLDEGWTLPPALLEARWAPRADDFIACVIAAQALPIQPSLLAQLDDPGPDADTLALGAVQLGRIVAWSPHLLEWPLGERVARDLLRLLGEDRPEPLLALIARALAPLTASKGPVPQAVRDAAVACLRGSDAHGRAGAYILGFAADPIGAMFETFLDGLVAGAHVEHVVDLVAAGLANDDEAAALALAARIPCDPLADALRACVDDPEYGDLAAAACALLDPTAEEIDLRELPAEPVALDDDPWCRRRDDVRRHS